MKEAIEEEGRAVAHELERFLNTLGTIATAAFSGSALLAHLYGGAVTKINHDLRNILSTARLVSDRLLASDDPTVRRNSRALLAAIDRAVELCSATLNFTREGPPVLEQTSFPLAELIEEVALTLPVPAEGEPPLRNQVPETLIVEADRSQLFRIFANLTQNAAQAGANRIEITARREGERIVVEVSDNGPGLAPRARDNLFQPFAGSARPGGSGLGLAIVRELVRAHGGNIRLLRSTAEGTVFAVDLPQKTNKDGQKSRNGARKSKAA